MSDADSRGDVPLCRICYSPCCGQPECIHAACACKGSVGHAHKHCIRKWMIVSGETRCRLCTQTFKFHASPDDSDDDDDHINRLYSIDPKTFTWAIFLVCLYKFFSQP